MFGACCRAQLSPEQKSQNQHIHRLGNPKVHKNKAKINQITFKKSEVTSYVNQFEVSGKKRSHLEHSEKNLLTSFLFPHTISSSNAKNNLQHSIKKSPIRQYNFCATSRSNSSSADIFLKYSALQQKYIDILEKSNRFLQRQVYKSRFIEQKVNSSREARSRSKELNSQLMQLKNRLNKIDFSGVKKISQLQVKNKQISVSKEKENFFPKQSAFKLLRMKIQ